MREIKFRGFHKCKDGKTVITVKGKKKRGTWFYGSYCPYTWSFASRRINEPQIIIHDENNENDGLWVEVVPETVGQFTGLKDKKGKKIYEGDIVGFRRKKKECIDVCYDKGQYLCKVKTGINCTTFYQLCSFIDKYQCEVIGNIYENPELLEGNNENN